MVGGLEWRFSHGNLEEGQGLPGVHPFFSLFREVVIGASELPGRSNLPIL